MIPQLIRNGRVLKTCWTAGSVGPELQNQGLFQSLNYLKTAILQELGYEAEIFNIYGPNPRSKYVHQKLGYKVYKEVKVQLADNTTVVDSYFYRILSEIPGIKAGPKL